MFRGSFKKDLKKRILCPNCNAFLAEALFDPETNTSPYTKSTYKDCWRCHKLWEIVVPEMGVTKNGKRVIFFGAISDDKKPVFTIVDRTPLSPEKIEELLDKMKVTEVEFEVE